MNKKVIVNEIISFGYKYGVFSKSIKRCDMREALTRRIEESAFIENLINTIFLRTRNRFDIDVDRTINLLCGLDRARWNLEYKRSI